MTDRGATDRGATDRGAADRGAADRGAAGQRAADRRAMVASLALLVFGALLLLLAASQWARVASESVGGGLGPSIETGIANEAVDVTRACGWLALAGVAGVLACRGWLRRVVGLLLLTSAGFTAYVAAFGAGADGASSPWRWVAGAAALTVCVAALMVAMGGHKWPSLSKRYESDAAGQPATRANPLDAWRAQDRGEDPTQ